MQKMSIKIFTGGMTLNFFVVVLPNVPILLLQTILSKEFCVQNSQFSETHNVQELIHSVKSPKPLQKIRFIQA
jgi:hypothetical protein